MAIDHEATTATTTPGDARTLSIDGAALCYDVRGAGPRTFALAHGWCSHRGHWDAQFGHLAATNRVLRWDRRGMGASRCEQPALTPQRHAEDLLALLDTVGADRTVVVGHAGGGPTALRFAVDHAERTEALILVDAVVHRPPTDGSVDRFGAGLDAMVARLSAPDGAQQFEAIYRSYFGPRTPPEVVDAAVANALATPLAVAVADLLPAGLDNAALAAQVRCPVLYVSARPADSAHIAGCFTAAARLDIGHVVDSGHFVQVEVPEQLNAMIDAFVAALDRT